MSKFHISPAHQYLIARIKIFDDTDPSKGLTGLSSSSSGLVISTIASNEASPVEYLQSASDIETITTLGTHAAPTSGKCRFREVDSTNHPGVYEVQLDNGRFAVANAASLLVSISGATDAADCDFEFQTDAMIGADMEESCENAIVTKTVATAADVAAIEAITSQEVYEEIKDFIDSELYAEVGTIPARTNSRSMGTILREIHALLVARITQSNDTLTVYQADGSSTLATATTDESGGLTTRGEVST